MMQREGFRADLACHLAVVSRAGFYRDEQRRAPREAEYPPSGLAGERATALRQATFEPFSVWYRMILRRFGGSRG